MTDCAGTNTIAALLAGAIDSEAAHRLEHHLDACATCRRLVADLGRGLSAIASPGSAGALPKIGDRVGRFTIERLIGVGGMGVVFEARDPALDRSVAVKLLRPDIVAGELLLDEAQAMARLRHPNIAVVHDVGRSGGQLYVCMEYVAGSTLRAWLAARPRTWREIAEVFAQTGRGLAYVHAAGLVHRDFKPDNVLMGGDGRVVVTDFGLARVVDRRVGTPAYMAPEQVRGDRVDARADQYAFCVALREATGDHAPRWLRRIIARGLAERPADRFASMDDLVAAIDARLHAPPRALVRTVGVVAVAALAAFAIPRAREVVTHVIDRPVGSRVVEARPPRLIETRAGAPAPVAGDAPPRRDPIEHVVAAPAPRGSWLDDAPALPELADVAPLAETPVVPHLTPASFELPGGFTPVATCDDGTVQRCGLAEPACPPMTIAAIQNGCWTCADDRSCAPLGLPRSCDDGSRLTCAAKPPACPGHDIASIHAGCWRCDDPFACRLPAGGAPPRHEPRCGNLVCETGEDAMTCPSDCHGNGSGNGSGSGSGSGSPSCNHNGFCEAGETHDSCPSDCCVVQADGSCAPVCGNGFCENGESHASCPEDC